MDATTELPLLLDSKQVAALLNVRRQRVYALDLPVVKIGPRTYRWHRADVLRLCNTAVHTRENDSDPERGVATADWARPCHVDRPWRLQAHKAPAA
jgi:hypothetical protein